MIKAGSAAYLNGYNGAQIDKGFAFIRELKMDGVREYLKLDVDLCIGAVRDANLCRSIHNALPAPEGKRMEKSEALGLFASMRNNLDIKPAEPARIDTAAVEAELKERGIV